MLSIVEIGKRRLFVDIPPGRFGSSRPSLRRRYRVGNECAYFFCCWRKSQFELVYIWDQATPEAKVIIFFLFIFSVIAWFVMISKAIQMRQAKKLNQFFTAEFRSQKAVLDMFDRKVQAEVARCSWFTRPAAWNWMRG